jgi:hypothetical protein
VGSLFTVQTRITWVALLALACGENRLVPVLGPEPGADAGVVRVDSGWTGGGSGGGGAGDSGRSDAGAPDAGDAGRPDGGDAGSFDGGDGGPSDGGDAGSLDGGDAGHSGGDAGSPDAGLSCPTYGFVRSGHCYDFISEPIATALSARLHHMVRDAQSHVSVVFLDERAKTTKYTRRIPGTGWSTPLTVANSGFSFNDIALEPSGAVTMIYSLDQGSGYGVGWSRALAGSTSVSSGVVQNRSATDSFGFQTLTIDSTGTMHASYSDGYDHVLHYARGSPSASGFSFATAVYTPTDVGGQSRIAVGPNYVPQVIYDVAITTGPISHRYQLFYRTGTAGGLTFSAAIPLSLATDEATAMESSLTVDANNVPHVLYFEHLAHQLIYARLLSGTWQKQVLTSDGEYKETDLKLDASGRPHFLWGYGFSSLVYGWLENGQLKTVIPAVSCNGQYNELELDADALPHITCFQTNAAGDDVLFYLSPRKLW